MGKEKKIICTITFSRCLKHWGKNGVSCMLLPNRIALKTQPVAFVLFMPRMT